MTVRSIHPDYILLAFQISCFFTLSPKCPIPTQLPPKNRGSRIERKHSKL